MARAIDPTTIGEHMTRSPVSIGREQTLAKAHEVMRAKRVRHLPVLDGGRLVGMVSQRDLNLIETLSDVDPSKVPVEEAMTPMPFAVSPDTPLDAVVREMVEKKYGSAVIMDGAHVVGVFTTIDALRLLGELLRGPRRGEGSEEAP